MAMLAHPRLPQQVVVDSRRRKHVRTVYSISGQEGGHQVGVIIFRGRKNVFRAPGEQEWQISEG